MSRLEKDHFMAQGVASKNCKAIYLMCLFLFFFALCVCNVSVLRAEHEGKNKMSVSHMTQHSLLVLFSEYIAGVIREQKRWPSSERMRETKDQSGGLFYRDAYSLGKKKRRSFYLSKTQCLSHFQSSNHRKLSPCSKLHQVAERESKRNEK